MEEALYLVALLELLVKAIVIADIGSRWSGERL
jgi:hypothetical protein